MSEAREYRRLLLRMGEASLARERRKPYAGQLPGTFLVRFLAAGVVAVIVVALFASLIRQSGLG